MPRPKIAVIGGGSFSWSPKLMRDILLKEEIENADVRLLDIDKEAADIISAIGKRLAKDWKLGGTFTPTTDPDRALDGADFVIITISTGGVDAMEHDIKVPERYGIFQTVADSVGPGGWARGLRNIPVFVTIAKRVQKNCPRAMILNYSNPMSTLTRTLSLATPQPVVGLCHGLFQNYRLLINIFGLKSEEELRASYAGINHFFWILDFSVNGRPGYPLLERKLRGGKKLDDLIRTTYVDPHGHASIRRLIASELYEDFGYLPYFGDRHTSEFFSRYLAPDRERLKTYHLVRTSAADRRRKRAVRRKETIALANGSEKMDRTRSRETACDIMAARWANADFIDVMNLPNVGQISNLPYGAVVETPGLVNMLGFAPVAVGPLPDQLVNVVLPHVMNQEFIVEAGLEGDWDRAYQALINDALCAHLPLPKVKRMGRQLLEANRRYLPQFFARRAGKRAS